MRLLPVDTPASNLRGTVPTDIDSSRVIRGVIEAHSIWWGRWRTNESIVLVCSIWATVQYPDGAHDTGVSSEFLNRIQTSIRHNRATVRQDLRAACMKRIKRLWTGWRESLDAPHGLLDCVDFQDQAWIYQSA